MDIDSLLTAQEVYLLRRSDNTIENTFCDTTGFLRSEILKPKEIPFLSLNILGGKFKPEHACFRILNKGIQKWVNDENIFFYEYEGDYEKLEKYCLIYINANVIHRKSFPYNPTVNTELKLEVEKFFNKFQTPIPSIINKSYNLEGQTKIVHDPTKLNYWHIEYNLCDFKDDPLKNKSSKYFEKFCSEILSNVLCINSYSTIDNIIDIPEIFYMKQQ